MKKLIIICIIATLCAGCGSNPVDKAIAQVQKSIDKLEKNKGKMTEADWQSLQKETEAPLKVIADAMENNKVGPLDKIKIMTVSAKWATAVMQAGFDEMKKAGLDQDGLGKALENATDDVDKTMSDGEDDSLKDETR